jgi:hypothetical protein
MYWNSEQTASQPVVTIVPESTPAPSWNSVPTNSEPTAESQASSEVLAPPISESGRLDLNVNSQPIDTPMPAMEVRERALVPTWSVSEEDRIDEPMVATRPQLEEPYTVLDAPGSTREADAGPGIDSTTILQTRTTKSGRTIPNYAEVIRRSKPKTKP